jgi:signal transduction histidine kinase
MWAFPAIKIAWSCLMSKDVAKNIFYHYLHDHASVFYLVVDRKGCILETNTFTEEVVGGELVGKTIRDVFVDFAMALDLETLVEDAEKIHLFNVNTFSGLPQTFYFNFIKQNECIYVLGRLDVNEIETLRKQLITANNELTNLTRQLQKTNAELEKLDRLKNQFLGMAAHDLRNPVSIILSYTELLQDELEGLDQEYYDFLGTIHTYADYMSRIINDFLDVALIESGRFELDLQLADVSDLIEQCLALANYQAGKRGITVEVLVEETLPQLLLDHSKIGQVINNLLSNAIEHSGDNTTVILRVKKTTDNILLSVKDQGEGIPEEMLAKIFNTFARSSIRKKSGKRSSGLGLAIAYKIIEAHNGKIWAESKVKQGTEFFVSLPINSIQTI